MGRFSPLLSAKVFARTAEETEKNKSLIKFPTLVSTKFDGWRALEYGDKLVGRSLKPPPNLFTQKSMSEFFAAAKDRGVRGLDGELLVGDPTKKGGFQSTGSGLATVSGEPDIQFYCFDSYQYTNEVFSERIRRVTDLVMNLKDEFPFVHPVPHVEVQDWDNLNNLLEHHIEEGHEGIMGRRPDGHYKLGRSSMNEGILWALKPYVDDEAQIIGFQEEMENTNPITRNLLGQAERKGGKGGDVPKGRLGAFICVSDLWPGVTFNVGAGVGLTHALRQHVSRAEVHGVPSA